MSKLRNYWLVDAPYEHYEVWKDYLERYARAHKMVIFDGKAIPPADYPCLCPIHCGPASACAEKRIELVGNPFYYETRGGNEPPIAIPITDRCNCPCHAYQDGDGAT